MNSTPELVGGDAAHARREALAVLAVAVLVALVAAWRARLGVSFYDDSHYVAVSLRLARGARPLADEMSLQSLGFLVPAAFVWVWTHLVGMTGLVLAYRLFYVVLAAGAGAIVYRALRPSFRPAIAGLGALVPLVCTPFNLIAPSYNTLALLGFMLAFALSFAAWRDGSRVAALIAGAAMTLVAVSYPPMTLAAIALLATLWWVSRDWRVVGLALAGGVVLFVTMLVPLARLVTLTDVQRALAYASANVHGFGSPLVKLGFAAGAVVLALVVPGLIPLWGLVVAACLRRVTGRWRAFVVLALPLAATVPGLQWARSGIRRAVFGNTGAAWLITFTIACAVPLWLWVRRTEHPQIRRLLVLAAPTSLVGFAIVSYSTDASLVRAVSVIGLAPLAMAVLMGWAEMVEELGIAYRHAVAWALVVGSAVVLLYTTSVDDRRPLALTSRVASGPFAGMRMSAPRRDELRELAAAGKRWVRPADRVTFLGERNGYLLVGGVPYTNAVWLYVGPSDVAALDYFARHGAMPDVVFVDRTSYVKIGEPDLLTASAEDPLLARVFAEYRLAETVDDFAVFVKR